MSLTSDGNMAAITWKRLGEMPPIANLTRFMPLDSPLVAHSERFIADRKARIGKVSNMTIEQQCQYYRKLGYY